MMGFFSRLFGRAVPGGPDSITRAPTGVPLRVAAIDLADPVRSDRLASLGLVPGCEIVLRQRRPTFVVDVGETTLALDATIAACIDVRPVGQDRLQ